MNEEDDEDCFPTATAPPPLPPSLGFTGNNPASPKTLFSQSVPITSSKNAKSLNGQEAPRIPPVLELDSIPTTRQLGRWDADLFAIEAESSHAVAAVGSILWRDGMCAPLGGTDEMRTRWLSLCDYLERGYKP